MKVQSAVEAEGGRFSTELTPPTLALLIVDARMTVPFWRGLREGGMGRARARAGAEGRTPAAPLKRGSEVVARFELRSLCARGGHGGRGEGPRGPRCTAEKRVGSREDLALRGKSSKVTHVETRRAARLPPAHHVSGRARAYIRTSTWEGGRAGAWFPARAPGRPLARRTCIRAQEGVTGTDGVALCGCCRPPRRRQRGSKATQPSKGEEREREREGIPVRRCRRRRPS